MDFGMRTLMHTSSSTSGCACWMEACWHLDFFAEAMKALLLLDILLLLLVDDGICQLLKSRDDVAVRAVLRDRLALGCGLREGDRAGHLRDDRHLLGLKELHELLIELAERVEVVDHEPYGRIRAGVLGDFIGAHGRFHIARAREHGDEDDVGGAAPIAHAVVQDARRIDNLVIAGLGVVRVIADLVDGAALRVGGYERHRGASALKRERQLVGEGGLADTALLVEEQNREHIHQSFHVLIHESLNQRGRSCGIPSKGREPSRRRW